jgi:rare lipoprotein A
MKFSKIVAPLFMAMLLTACTSIPKSPLPVANIANITDSKAVASMTPFITAVPLELPNLPAAGSGRGAYYQDDGPGDNPPEGLHATPDAIAKIEPYSRTGNRLYVVFGKTYVPLTNNLPFTQQGIGSWYGKKFHGKRTSSGEPYDMYKMTAAHPTLPIPSYARVTNLSNDKQVIVRINDRGPFHSSRIIDLSYTAALKLGYLGKGSRELKVERLLPDDIARIAENKRNPPNTAPQTTSAEPVPIYMASMIQSDQLINGFYLQLGAYAQADNAESARLQLAKTWGSTTLPPLQMAQSGTLYRLYSGPFSTRLEAANAANQVQNVIASKPMIVQR